MKQKNQNSFLKPKKITKFTRASQQVEVNKKQNFMQRFPDEASCIAYMKEQSGVVYKRCGCTEHRWDANKLSFECKHCHNRQSLRFGTSWSTASCLSVIG